MVVTDSPAVWRAAANPLRRRLIELLADGPRTTGDLARAFTVSRFAVMKHLSVLERSGVITVQRRGRERWNALTVGSGLALEIRESRSGRVSQNPQEVGPDSLFRIEQHVRFDAAPGRVFDALTFNISAWWGAPYLRSPQATNIVFEPQLGGRLLEEWGHRQGFIQGLVTAIRQDERLDVAGRIAGGGCLSAVLEFRLTPAERGTRLAMVHRGVAEPDAAPPGLPSPFEAAWADLLGTRLKAFVERGIRSGIVERPASADALLGWF